MVMVMVMVMVIWKLFSACELSSLFVEFVFHVPKTQKTLVYMYYQLKMMKS